MSLETVWERRKTSCPPCFPVGKQGGRKIRERGEGLLVGYVVIHLLWITACVPQGDDVHRLPDVVYPVNQFVVLVHHQAAVKDRQVGKVWLLPADVREGGKKLVVGKNVFHYFLCHSLTE